MDWEGVKRVWRAGTVEHVSVDVVNRGGHLGPRAWTAKLHKGRRHGGEHDASPPSRTMCLIPVAPKLRRWLPRFAKASGSAGTTAPLSPCDWNPDWFGARAVVLPARP